MTKQALILAQVYAQPRKPVSLPTVSILKDKTL